VIATMAPFVPERQISQELNKAPTCWMDRY